MSKKAGLTLFFAVVLVVGVAAAVAFSKNGDVSKTVSNTEATPEPTVAPKAPKLGDTVTKKNYSVTVHAVDASDKIGFDNFSKPQPGNVYFALDVAIASNNGKATTNMLFAKVRDAEGRYYSFTAVGVKQPYLSSQNNIPQGQQVRGWITYQIPQSIEHLWFEYQPLGDEKAIIQIN